LCVSVYAHGLGRIDGDARCQIRIWIADIEHTNHPGRVSYRFRLIAKQTNLGAVLILSFLS
jgi:hypothetical protein